MLYSNRQVCLNADPRQNHMHLFLKMKIGLRIHKFDAASMFHSLHTCMEFTVFEMCIKMSCIYVYMYVVCELHNCKLHHTLEQLLKKFEVVF